MTLLEDWKAILKKAWSVRLALIAAFFTGLQALLPLLDPGYKSIWFAVLSFIAAGGAVASRIIAQPDTLPRGTGEIDG